MQPSRSRFVRIGFSSAHIVATIGLSFALAACSMERGRGVDVVAHAKHAQPTKGDLSINWFFWKKRKIPPANPAEAVAKGFEIVEESDPTVSAVPDREVLEAHARVIRGGGRYWVGRPYEIAGQVYEPQEDPTYNRSGEASWYGSAFHGRLTANGEIFDRNAITAAHPTLPLPSYVRVTNVKNNRSIVVRINDRGPYANDRLIDVSEQTAAILGFRRFGLTHVRVEYVSRAPLSGDDTEALLATYSGPPATGPRVFLASGASAHPVIEGLAFAPDRAAVPAAAAIEKLTASAPAAERILAAFEAAEEAEE